MQDGDALAAAAESLIGARFRLHGRDPATGLDCVGVLDLALRSIGLQPALPAGYSLRSRRVAGLAAIAEACGFTAAQGDILPGDVLLVRTAPCQFHLLIAARTGRFIHADASLRRVAMLSSRPDWPVAGHWRLPDHI